jgi:hypothetical protein
MADSRKGIIAVVVIILLILLLLRGCGQEDIKSGGTEGIGIQIYYFDAEGNPVLPSDQLQAVVGGTADISSIAFGLTVTNGKTVGITDVNLNAYSDDTADGTSPFNQLLFTIPTFSLAAGETSDEYITDQFDVEWYSVNSPGVTRFTFNLGWDYINAEGLSTPEAGEGWIEINIVDEQCLDGTPQGQCNADGQLCSGNAIPVVEDSSCCATAGGVWSVDHCVFGCGALEFGECDDTPTPGTAKRLTYCDPVTAEMVEACGTTCSQGGVSHCYDFYGNTEVSCNVDSCVFDDFSGEVTVDVTSGGGSGSGSVQFRTSDITYPPGLNADNWVAYATICGSDLIGYGYDSTASSTTVGSCDVFHVSETFLAQNLPFTVGSLNAAGDGNARLYTDGATKMWVCENDADGVGYFSRRYATTRTNNAILSSISADPTTELTC